MFISLFFILTFKIQAQTTTKNYDVKVAGIRVGHITAIQKIGSNGVVSYLLDCKVDVNLLVYKMNSTFVLNEEYKNGQLLKARVDMNSNKGDFFTITAKTPNGYLIKGENQEGAFEREIKESIDMTVAKLYFAEPTNSSKVYAEFYGGFMRIANHKNGQYFGELNGNKDHFFYDNGNLMKSIKENGVKNLEFVYVNTTTTNAK